MLPNTDLDAEVMAERLRSAVEGLQIPHAKSQVSDFVTISLGMSVIKPMASQESTELINSADEALYQAKADGRNRVVTYRGSDS